MENDSHKTSSVHDCRLIELDKHHHRNGNLSVVENGVQLPYDVSRVYYLYDVPGGAERGGHSHRRCQTFILAVSGSFTVEVDDGCEKRAFTLNRSNIGLLVVPGVWRVLNNFSSGAVCLVLASDRYSEADYVRSYNDFLKLTENKRK